ncbi:hypothetical protein FRX31_030346, partial [Thalictrum thalictroides]
MAGGSGEGVIGTGSGTGNVTVDIGALMAQVLQAVQHGDNHSDPFAKRNKDFGTLGGQKFNGDA